MGCEMKASQKIAGALMSFYKKIKKWLSFLMTSMALEPLQVVFFLGLQSLQHTASAAYFMYEMQWYSSCLLKEKILLRPDMGEMLYDIVDSPKCQVIQGRMNKTLL